MSHRVAPEIGSCRTEISRFESISMATIRTRQRKDGSLAYLGEVRVKRDGEIVHRESRTFDRLAQARAWAETREKMVAKDIPATRQHQKMKQATLRKVLRRYREEVSAVRPMGRSKTSNIRFLEKCKIARMTACEIRSSDIITHVRSRRQRGAGPSTANNDIVWLRVILRYARAAWDLPFDLTVIDNASEVLKAEKLISKARSRSRRPTADELNALTELFERRDKRRSNIPMKDIMWFAIFSARRQSEITDLLFSDNDEESQTGAVRDLKHPTERDLIRRFKYAPDAWEIACRQVHDKDRIFPYEPRSIGSAFRQACKLLKIHDLRFHDLRHEATSRLFEQKKSFLRISLASAQPISEHTVTNQVV